MKPIAKIARIALRAARMLVLALAMSLLGGQPARAQYPGDRVRVSVPSQLSAPAVGRIARTDTSTMRLEVERVLVLTIPLGAIDAIEISRGTPWGRNTLLGAGAGLLAGAIIGAVVVAEEVGGDDPLGELVGGMAGAFGGGVVGIPIGAFAGASLTRERWRPAHLPSGSTSAESTPAVGWETLPGERLRVTPRGGARIAGSSIRSSEQLRLEAGDSIATIPWADITALEARGRKRRLGTFLGGALLGGATLIAGGIDVSQDEVGAGEWMLSTALNTAIGAGLGYLLAPPGWIQLPLPVRR